MTFDDKLDKILLSHGAEQGELHYSLKKAIKDLVLSDVVGGDRVREVKNYSSPTWTSGKYCNSCGFDIKENTSVCGCTEVNKKLEKQRLIINGKESSNE